MMCRFGPIDPRKRRVFPGAGLPEDPDGSFGAAPCVGTEPAVSALTDGETLLHSRDRPRVDDAVTRPIRKLGVPGTWPHGDEHALADGLVSDASPGAVADLLRARTCPPDRAFDRHLPPAIRAGSPAYFTPLSVAVRAATWLDEASVRTVVDIGSGAGKFCVAAALAGNCTYIGMEQRGRLVSAARDLARLFECDDRVRFLHAEFGVRAPPVADAYYFYNPFAENVFGYQDPLDHDAPLSEERYARDLAATSALLGSVKPGTYLLTYAGFGGRVPPTFCSVRVDRRLPNVLQLWRKMDRHSDGLG
jgi:SAM-dependent methyltransferase